MTNMLLYLDHIIREIGHSRARPPDQWAHRLADSLAGGDAGCQPYRARNAHLDPLA